MTAPLPPGARPPERAVWINGRICRGLDAMLSIADRGARDGQGLFETLRVYGGHPFRWQPHLERMVLSAAELGFPVPPSPATLREALGELLEVEGLSEAVVRLTITRGVAGGRPTRAGAWLEVEPLGGRLWSGPRAGRASAIFSKMAFHPGPLGRHKTTSRLAYHLAHEEARAEHADEALLVDPSGVVLEGATSNVFAIADRVLLTPPLAAGILPGVTRAVVLRLAQEIGLPACEQPLTPADLARATEVFVTNSVQEVVPLSLLGGRQVREQSIGRRLHDHYADTVARETASVRT